MALSTLSQILPRVIYLNEISAPLTGISLTLCLYKVLVPSDVVTAFTLLSTICFRRLLASVDSVGWVFSFVDAFLSRLCNNSYLK